MSDELITWLIGQTGVTGILGLSLFLVRYIYIDSTRREKEHVDEISRIHDESQASFDRYVDDLKSTQERYVSSMNDVQGRLFKLLEENTRILAEFNHRQREQR